MFDYDKLKDAIHYICERANTLQKTLDEVKLNKVLWYSDALTYLKRGQPITGTTYMRKPRGPVAKFHSKAVNQLLEAECIVEGKVLVDGEWRKTFDAIEPASKEVFSGAELQLIDTVFDYVTGVSSDAISEQTHGHVWHLAREGEVLPLFTAFAEGRVEPSAADLIEAAAA